MAPPGAVHNDDTSPYRPFPTESSPSGSVSGDDADLKAMEFEEAQEPIVDPVAPTPATEGAVAAAATAATGTANAFQAIQLPVGQVANTSGLHSGMGQTSSARDAVRLALIEGYAGNAEALNKVLSNLDEALANRTPAVSTVKSTTKSHPPATFHGHASDHGHAAQSWLYSVQLYYQAENEHNPVAKVATYLREHALDWWQQLGSKTLPPDANFTAFSEAFLARYVKPSDSQKACKELPTLRQSDNESVGTFSAHFRSVNSRITVGSPIDTTTLAGYFLHGIKSKIFKAMSGFVPMEAMQNVDLAIAAAEDMEAKLSLVDKQVQSGVNAIGHATSGKNNCRSQGRGQTRGGPIRQRDSVNALQPARGGRFGGRSGPYNPRGAYTAVAHNNGGASKPAAAANAGARGKTHKSADAGGNAGAAANEGQQAGFDDRGRYSYCHIPGHNLRVCRKLQRENDAAGGQQVISPSAYRTAYAIHQADLNSEPAHANSVLRTTSSHDADTALLMQSEYQLDTSALLADIGSPQPCNVMADPALVNPDWAPDHLGHVCALSPTGLTMLFHGLIAMNDGRPITVLVDTSANHCYISQQCFDEHLGDSPIGIRAEPNWLTLANGSATVSKGACVVPLDIQSYQTAIECYTLPLSDQFDLVLGQDWGEETGAEISFRTHSLDCLDFDGHSHRLYTQPGSERILCPIVSALTLEKELQDDDQMYVVHVTQAGQSNNHTVSAVGSASVSNDTSLQSILNTYKDCFPAELPVGLPRERSVYHAVTLKDENDPPPLRKLYRLSQAETAELNKQILSLLEKGYIQPSNSPYGSPVLFVRKANGSLRMCIDYRALNKQTVKSRYPLPRIDDLFDKLQGAQVFSSIDLQSAYYQVRLKPEDVPKTAFTTPMGLYEFRVLCFGLTNAPGTFQNIMNDVLRDVIGNFVLVYLDDIVILSKSKAEHYKHLRVVLQL